MVLNSAVMYAEQSSSGLNLIGFPQKSLLTIVSSANVEAGNGMIPLNTMLEMVPRSQLSFYGLSRLMY